MDFRECIYLDVSHTQLSTKTTGRAVSPQCKVHPNRLPNVGTIRKITRDVSRPSKDVGTARIVPREVGRPIRRGSRCVVTVTMRTV